MAERKGFAQRKGFAERVLGIQLSYIRYMSELAKNVEGAVSLGQGIPFYDLPVKGELADAVIRIMDYFEHNNFCLETYIKLKHRKNKSRSYRHEGKKY